MQEMQRVIGCCEGTASFELLKQWSLYDKASSTQSGSFWVTWLQNFALLILDNWCPKAGHGLAPLCVMTWKRGL